jgi:hypothetical protein
VHNQEDVVSPAHVMRHPYQEGGSHHAHEGSIVNKVDHACCELVSNKRPCCLITPLSKRVDPRLALELDVRGCHLVQESERENHQNTIALHRTVQHSTAQHVCMLGMCEYTAPTWYRISLVGLLSA